MKLDGDGLKLLGATLGAIPPILTFAFTQVQERTVAKKQAQQLDNAIKHVNFIDTWFKAQSLICESDEIQASKVIAKAELAIAFSNVSKLTNDNNKILKPFRNSTIAQRLFLLYRPYKPIGWVIHTLFYMFLGTLVLALIGAGTTPTEKDDPHGFYFVIGLLFMCGIPLIILNICAARLAARTYQQSAQQSSVSDKPQGVVFTSADQAAHQ